MENPKGSKFFELGSGPSAPRSPPANSMLNAEDREAAVGAMARTAFGVTKALVDPTMARAEAATAVFMVLSLGLALRGDGTRFSGRGTPAQVWSRIEKGWLDLKAWISAKKVGFVARWLPLGLREPLAPFYLRLQSGTNNTTAVTEEGDGVATSVDFWCSGLCRALEYIWHDEEGGGKRT